MKPHLVSQVLHEVLPSTDNLFNHINYSFLDFTPEELNIMLLSRAANRSVSPLIGTVQGNYDIWSEYHVLTPSELGKLGDIILKNFRNKWDRYSSITSLEYDIIANVNLHYYEAASDESSAATERLNKSVSSRGEVLESHSNSKNDSSIGSMNKNSVLSDREITYGTHNAEVEKTQTGTSDASTEFLSSNRDLLSKKEGAQNDIELNKETSQLGQSDESFTLSAATDAQKTDTGSLQSKENKAENKEYTSKGGLEKSISSNVTSSDGGGYTEETQRLAKDETSGSNDLLKYGYNSVNGIPFDSSDTSNNGMKSELEKKKVSGVKTDNNDISSSKSNTDMSAGESSNEASEHISAASLVNDTKDRKASEAVKKKASEEKELASAKEKENKNSALEAMAEKTKNDKTLSGSSTSDEDRAKESIIKGRDLQTSSLVGGSNSASTSSNVSNSENKQDNLYVTDEQNRLSDLLKKLSNRFNSYIKRGIDTTNLTPQDFIKKEIDLWRWNFVDEVMKDIISLLTSSTYN